MFDRRHSTRGAQREMEPHVARQEEAYLAFPTLDGAV